MKKFYVFSILIFILILFVGIYAAIVKSPVTGNQILSVEDLTNTKMNLVKIKDSNLLPQELIIKEGDWVRWSNYDDSPHIIFFSEDLTFKIDSMDSFDYYFTKKGIYKYFILENEVEGKIVVE